jgi:hypothetical protein
MELAAANLEYRRRRRHLVKHPLKEDANERQMVFALRFCEASYSWQAVDV